MTLPLRGRRWVDEDEREQSTMRDTLDRPYNMSADDDDMTLESLATNKPIFRRFGNFRNRRILVIALVAIVLLALIGGVVAVTRVAQRNNPIVQKVHTGTITLSVSAHGVLQSAIYNVDFLGQGLLSEIDVKIGQQVQQGDTLAKLDPTSLQNAVNQAQAQVDGDQTNLNDAQSTLSAVQAQTSAQESAAFDTEQSAITACKSNSGCIQNAQDQYASVQAQANAQNAAAQAAVDSAQGALNTAQATLAIAQGNLNNTTLTAPHDGVVTTINGSVGGRPGDTSAGTNTGVFIQLVDLSQLQVAASVNEKDVGGVATQNIAQFTVDTYGARKFNGTVTGVDPTGVTTGGTVTYPVLIDVDSQGFASNGIQLLPGMQCKVTIVTQQRTNVPLIPLSALRFAEQSAPQSGKGLLTRKQIVAALAQAQQLQLNLVASGVDLSQDHPTNTYLVGYLKGAYVALPVVLGLTDGKNYEVLSGLDVGGAYVVGQHGFFG